MARIGIFGAGYVGLVTGACFADLGHEVVVRDVLPERIEALRAGEVPIYEPGLDEVLARCRDRISFTLDVQEAVAGADFLYVAVGTPPTYAGDADLSAVWTVVDELPEDARATIVMKSTVPVGTGEKVRAALDARGLEAVGYVSNPEFTAEGTAIRDFMQPDRIVIGAFDEEHGDRVEALHAGIDAPVVRADVNSAEMIKLAANAFLSARISFINEIANVCELVDADVQKVAEGVGLDHRLGPHFLRAGIGFGGSCFDGRESALVRLAGRSWLTSMRDLHELAREGLPLEALSWRAGAERPEFAPVSAVTRRRYGGEIIELRTKMGRRLRLTADHPVITRAGVKRADEVDARDWLPLALGAPGISDSVPLELDVLEDLRAEDGPNVIVRAPALAGVTAQEIKSALPALSKHRPYDILRAGAIRLDEAEALGVSLDDASFGTATNGTYVPAKVVADDRFWRVVGLYIAEGHVSADGRRRRLQWSFHPTNEPDLVEEVRAYWASHGAKPAVRSGTTTTSVVVSSRLLAEWWLEVLGL